MRHDDTTDFLAKCLRRVHTDNVAKGALVRHSVAAPPLQTAVQDADIRVRGFWNDCRNAFFDTRVFYPHALNKAFSPRFYHLSSARLRF